MIKQVMVVRRDLNMRRGKEAAQVAHASMAFLLDRLRLSERYSMLPDGDTLHEGHHATMRVHQHEAEWLGGKLRTKIVLQVDGEVELYKLYEKAQTAGLTAHLVLDAGKTEFGGRPTFTCLAIGPDDEQKIDPITRDLKVR